MIAKNIKMHIELKTEVCWYFWWWCW